MSAAIELREIRATIENCADDHVAAEAGERV